MDSIDEKKFLFQWLFQPEKDIDLDYLIKLGKRYAIPDNIMIRKIIVSQSIFNQKDKSVIWKNLLANRDMMENYDINLLKSIVEEEVEYPKNNRDEEIVDKIDELAGKYQSISDHSGYPMPDKWLGRPHLDWCECYYYDCHQSFSSPLSLKNHLIKFGKYIYGLYRFHEIAVTFNQLTPEKVLKNKIRRCPSILCDKKHSHFSPSELCDHFKSLGIKPFWQEGIELKMPNSGKELFKPIFIYNECLICRDRVPSVICFPCYHYCICLNCHEQISRCPLCRTIIKKAIPF